MRLTLFMMLVFMLQLSARSYSQKEKVSLNFSEASLEKVFSEIKRQTSFDFFYSSKYLDIKKKVSVKSDGEYLYKVMNDLLGGEYNIAFKNSIILITPVKSSDPDNKDKLITGVVKDKNGNPLPGVSVVLKGTNIGVSTDINGKFQIKVPAGDKKESLKFSFIGMKTKYLVVGKKTKYQVVLEDDTAELEEVVITGYQRIEKRKLTSSVVTVKGKDVVEPVATSIDKMLQGKIAGMAVMNQSSTPGAAPKIRIRGSSSITGNREPVWVVDGVVLRDPVPISTEELNSMDKVNLIGNAISSLNPQDIERIDVLKDASATAIYGTKAANGVIVITTKRGKRGPMQINYTSSYSVTSRPTYDGMFRMNSAERIDVSEEMRNKGLAYETTRPSHVSYEGALIDLWNKELTVAEFDDKVNKLRNNNTDWFDLLFRNSFSTNQSLSFSGADDKTSYYGSIGFADNKGATKGVSLKRYNATVNLSTKFSDKFSVDFGIRGSFSDTKRNHNSVSMMEYAYNTSRAIPAYNPDGSRFFYAEDIAYHRGEVNSQTPVLGFNIFNELENSGMTNHTNTLGINLNLNYRINTYLKYSGMVAYNLSNNYSEDWANERSYYISEMRRYPYGLSIPKEDPYFRLSSMVPYGGEMYNSETKNSNYTIRNTFTFNYHFGERHSITSNLGFEITSGTYKGLTSTQYGYLPLRGKKVVNINPVNWPKLAEMIASHPNKYTDRKDNMISYYGTLSYGFDDKYIFNFNIRGDGSNKFGADKSTRFVPIWSVSARWSIDQEPFLRDSEIVNALSIIGSYGTQGNVPENNSPYLVVDLGTLDAISDQYMSTLHGFPNKFLRWEKTYSYNLGFDFALFNNFLNGGFQLYKKIGKDQIITKDITSTNGATKVYMNGGDIENKGWEISFSATPIKTKDFSLGLSFNTSKNYNKVTNAGLIKGISYAQYLDGSIIKDGYAVNSFFSYKFDKLDENGYPMFKDINIRDKDGKRVVNSQEEAFDRAFAFSGSREPELTGGFTTSFRYKRLSVSALFSYSMGSHIRLNNLYKEEGQALPYPQQNMSSEYVNRWKKGINENTVIPTLSDKAMMLDDYLASKGMMLYEDSELIAGDNLWNMYNNSDLRVVKGDFLRCRSISLSYSMADSLCKKFHMKGISLGLSMNNIFCLKDKKLKGRDPEQVALGSKVIPPQRTYSFSLSVNF